jgi:hypothetical protein
VDCSRYCFECPFSAYTHVGACLLINLYPKTS